MLMPFFFFVSASSCFPRVFWPVIYEGKGRKFVVVNFIVYVGSVLQEEDNVIDDGRKMRKIKRTRNLCSSQKLCDW